MSIQRYVVVLADTAGNTVTPSAQIAQLVLGSSSGTGKRRRINSNSASTTEDSNTARATFERKVRENGFDPTIVAAIISVESSGEGFNNGRLLIRFEPHVFLRRYAAKILGKSSTSLIERTNFGKTVIFPGMRVSPEAKIERKDKYGNILVSKMMVSSNDSLKRRQDGRRRNLREKQDSEYAALQMAASVDRELAYISTSFGSGQVMGFNHKIVGYESAYAMYRDFKLSEDVQDLAMLNFLINRRGTDKPSGLTLADAVREGNFKVVAKLYNGDTTGTYSNRMSKAHNRIIKTRRIV